jgi:hypothetical protein
MRWRFPDPRDTIQGAARAAIEHRITAWWKAFERDAPRIDAYFRRRERWDLAAWMKEHLGTVDPALMWEFGPGLRGGHRLVITPESERRLRPLTTAVLSRAPTLAGWEFYPYRLAEPRDLALLTVQGRCGVDFGRFRASVQATSDGGVDLVFWSREVDAIGMDAARGAAFVATESLLGEEVLDNFVNVIDAAADPAGDDVDLGALAPAVAAKLEAARARLSPAPLVERTDLPYTLWELKPREAADYTHQHDLFVGKSSLPEMWTRAHSNGTFSSARFSRFGETFCYVKLDGSEGLGEGGFADKSEIEDALEAALAPASLGALTGGGTGRRYAYVDLALRNVDESIPIIRETLRRGRVPRRSWLLFFDSTLRDEWVGIWDETPPPP